MDATITAWRGLTAGSKLSAGRRNSVWDARLGGRRVVLHRSRRPEASLLWELELLVDLDAAGFRVPRPVRADCGRLAVDGWSVRSWVAGRPPADGSDWLLVAEELRRLHAWGRTRVQRPWACEVAGLPERRVSLDADLDGMPSDAAASVVAGLAALRSSGTTVIHGDPCADNVRIAADGSVSLLDWDESRIDDPDLDLANLGVAVLDGRRRVVAELAADAWEAANAWKMEPEYAARRLQSLRRRLISRDRDAISD